MAAFFMSALAESRLKTFFIAAVNPSIVRPYCCSIKHFPLLSPPFSQFVFIDKM